MINLAKRIFRRINRKPVVQKTYEKWASKGYNPSPLISFVIQTHNRSSNVIRFVEKLREIKNSEVIVIDDGSNIKESSALINALNKANDFIIRANDLYEVLTYDRAIYLARGKYVALLQDDDDFENTEWITDAVNYFEKFPDMVFLGGRLGLNLKPFEITDDKERGEFEVSSLFEQRKNSFKYEVTGKSDKAEKFKFVQFVIRAPMWVNRDLFIKHIGSIDPSFAPFQWDDAEVCLRAYTKGLKVGWYKANFQYGGGGEGGMRIWNNILHHRQDKVNAAKVYDLYGSQLAEIQVMVDKANTMINN